MRRSRAIVVVALALLGGMIALGVWLRGTRRSVAETPVPDATATAALPASRPTTPIRPAPPPVPQAPPPAPEEELLVAIRAQVRSAPGQAESLARQARARFPASPHADEWDALLVDALVNQERIGAARSETYYYYDHHPDGAFAAHLFALTGLHPTSVGPGPPRQPAR